MFHVKQYDYDIIVIGGGHAGCEASVAASKMGSKVLLCTTNIEQIAQMSCNPSIGGLAKGNLVKDIDALGGIMAKVIDRSGIQFRVLNTKKGPAVRSTRAQADKSLYMKTMQDVLMGIENLHLKQCIVSDILVKNRMVVGIKTIYGEEIFSKAIILSTGTFLNGLIHIGDNKYSAGRANEFASTDLTLSLKKLGFEIGRLKTGTPARLDKRTIDFNSLKEHWGEKNPKGFSFETKKIVVEQIPCFITYTNKDTHNIIMKNLEKSALYGGHIKAVGPRYCPSIEDKVVKFPDKDRHQVFIEPEGLNTLEMYANGLSTSLPVDVQLKFYRSIKGLERVEFIRPAYAIEYDYANPVQLKSNLETKKINGLFFAGQINGTTGYEEAAAQGLIAGINAVKYVDKKDPFILGRDESFIGVMIDDLVTKGIDEPYRMFHSRAEYRLILREDNAEFRLIEKGFKLGLINKTRYDRFKEEESMLSNEIIRLKNSYIEINSENLKKVKLSAYDALKRTEVKYNDIEKIIGSNISEKIANELEILIKYEGYIQKINNDIKMYKKLDSIKIPKDFNYNNIPGLRREFVEKFNKIRPGTLAQAIQIPGVTPSAIAVLHVYIKKRDNERANKIS